MNQKTVHSVGIIMNGVTGRMGLNQHLRRSLYAIMQQGGVALSDSEAIMPRLLLVGRSPAKLEAISKECGGLPFTTDLDEALADSDYSIYFDAQTTDRRADSVRHAIAAGKHIYCEKPIAGTVETAMELYCLAQQAGVKHGVVQDKLWLPGLLKLQTLRDLGFFGRILSIRGEFGYWVFEGDTVPAQRPSWNYRAEDGGGIILDMLCHWRYVIDNVFCSREGRILPWRDAHPRARRRSGPHRTNARPTTPPMPPSSWKTAPSPTSTPPGASACAATTC